MTPENVAEAKAKVPAITPEEASRLADVVFLDVREPSEVEASGKVAGALNIPRGMLDVQADPSSPRREAALDPTKTVVTYCGVGGRAALAAARLKELGFADVRHMGGFKDWAEKGLPVERG
ncbi:Rhodanese-like domain protein [Rubellimicrobium mesophilum DSM 19309]|uniref:Rhodanese-like domain protein n=2 Tax=Rubellimicrobium TaxID=295418 RepID=A0A017HLR5_9RHOB|nr:Rhodanese-like domain protein [Rubellimicrobium mesophilum DSM 19309]